MCDHCFNASDFRLPSGVNICAECFYESYCVCCWNPITQVGETNGEGLCLTCINNIPDQIIPFQPINDININIIYNNDAMDETDDTDSETDSETDELVEPPEGFDMNAASALEQNPDYMNNLINAQVEYNGRWYFVYEGQIYSVHYEIEIDDNFVRQDIIENWEGLRWDGSIFGEYIAWY
jgi:hypothetical protein